MTRGPLPKKAIAAAQDIGAGRGMVLDAAGMQESHHDFTIFGSSCTVYVRVKRIRSHVADSREIDEMFGEDVHMIRKVPLTPVVAREIWTLSPWGCWQYFLVLEDRIVEIHRNGTPVLPAVPVNGERPTFTNPALAITRDAPATSSVAGVISPSPTVTPG